MSKKQVAGLVFSLVLLATFVACSSEGPGISSSTSSSSTTTALTSSTEEPDSSEPGTSETRPSEPGTTVPGTSVPGTDTTTSVVATTSTTIAVPSTVGEDGFDDHTVPKIGSRNEFFALAKDDPSGRSVLKFNVPALLDGGEVRWMDSNFYRFHDEWYWFRLLNGRRVPAVAQRPITGLDFSTVDEVYSWAAKQDRLPLSLRFFNDRLADNDFYRLSIGATPRNYILGSLLHVPERGSADEFWLVELEFTDDPTAREIELLFDELTSTLPDEISRDLRWVTRSDDQRATAEEMIDRKLAFADRVISYAEVVPPGTVDVYNPGVAAGRLYVVGTDGRTLDGASSTDIVIIESVPDELPPAAGLITSDPQTPLAHVNLLARNRGIPNVSQAGVLSDPAIAQAARIRAKVAMVAGPDGLELVVMTDSEYQTWRDFNELPGRVAVPSVDREKISAVVSLDELAEEAITDEAHDEWRPIIGGKATGFLSLLQAGVETPRTPMAVSVGPYFEHVESIDAALDDMLNSREFRASREIRYLVLEGPEDYSERFTSDDDIERARTFVDDLDPAGSLAAILDAGGFKKYFRAQPIDPSTLAGITQVLTETYGPYAQTQGIRFRSSSSVEDIDGFNGAGLYDSNTGFLVPEAQESPKDQKKSVEYSLKKTWASYWSFEAFEERKLANIDHRSGGMGVLVHARFDDPLEQNNGVATYGIGAGADVVEINVQLGDVSVANPEDGALPEVLRLTTDAGESWRIERVQTSSETAETVLTDAAAIELAMEMGKVTKLWQDRTDRTDLTLDFEFKTMAAGWPAYRGSGEPAPERLVIKQARTLEVGQGLSQDAVNFIADLVANGNSLT